MGENTRRQSLKDGSPAAFRLRRAMTAALVLTIAGLHLATTPIPNGPPDRRVRNGFVTQPPKAVQPRRADDIEGMLKLAQWAVQNNVSDEATQLYRLVLQRQPENLEAWTELHELLSQHNLSIDTDAVEQAEDVLSNRFQRFETAHFIMLSDANADWTRQQGDRLERTWHQFNRFTKRADLRPLPLKHKLLCILFAAYDDYASFARAHDAVQEAWIAGYYSPGNDRVVFYNVHSSPEVVEARVQLGDMEEELTDFRTQLREAVRDHRTEEAGILREFIGRYKQHLASEKTRLEAFASNVSTATTIHEATHQLFFHTNVQSARVVEYPFWISEGFATSFETDEPNAAFGPDVEYDVRRDGFLDALEDDRLIPLSEFVTMTKPNTSDSNAIAAMYNQSYALLTWLHANRRDELRDYLFTMLARSTGRPSALEHRRLFEAAFGPIASIESEWLRDEGDGAISVVTVNEPASIRCP